MADITQDTRFDDYLKYLGISRDQFDSADGDKKTEYENGIEDYKIKFPPQYSEEDALSIANDVQKLDDLTPAELASLNNSLADNATKNQEANEAFDKVQKKISEKVKNYANDDIKITIDDVAGMQAVIDAQMDGEDKTIAENKAKALTRLKEFEETYDKENGLFGVTKDDIELIDKNFENLASITSENIFALTEYTRPEVIPMSLETAKDIITKKEYHSLSMAELASLRATMSKSPAEFDNAAHEAVVGIARDKVLRVANGKHELADALEAASFNTLLDNVSYEYTKNPKLIDAKKLQDANQIFEKFENELKDNKTTKNPEMQEIYDLFSAIEVTGDVKLFGYEKLEQKDENGNFLPDSEIGLLIEDIKAKTKKKLLSSKKELNAESYISAFKEEAMFSITEVWMAEQIAQGKSTKKEWSKNVDALKNAVDKNGKIKINRDSFVASEAKHDDETRAFIRRLEGKTGKTKTTEGITKENNTLNAKKEAKHGDKYKEAKQAVRNIGKSMFKSASWGAAFGIASQLSPTAVRVVAIASVGNQIASLRKDYKKQKEDMAKNGKKLGLGSFLKSNTDRLITVGVASAAIVLPEIKVAQKALGAAIALKSARKPVLEAIKNPSKENIWRAAGVVGSLAAGYFVGKEIGAAASDSYQSHQETQNLDNTKVNIETNTTNSAEENTSEITVNPNDMYNGILDVNRDGISDYIQDPEFLKQDIEAMQHIDGANSIDRNGDGIIDIAQDPNKVQEDIDNKFRESQAEREAILDEKHLEAERQTEEQRISEAQAERKAEEQRQAGEQRRAGDADRNSAEQNHGTKESETISEEQIAQKNEQLKPLEIKPLEVSQTNVDELIAQAQEQMMDQRIHTIVDSNGQTVQYTTDKDGLHLVNADKIIGHENLNEDIAKDVAARAATGQASQNDLAAMQNRASPELLAQMQNDYDAHRAQNEVLLAENNQEAKENNTQEDKKETVQQETKPLSMSGKHEISINGVEASYTVDSATGTVRVVGEVNNVDQNLVKQLIPEGKVDENNVARVGSSSGASIDKATQIETMKVTQELKNIYRNEAAYQDMQTRSETHQLNKTELSFMERHDQKLADMGLARGEKGFEVQQTKDNSLITQNTLKVDMGNRTPFNPRDGQSMA